jgi:hypothetical protein
MISAIIIIGLVSFAITFFLKELDGPFNLIKKFRDRICKYAYLPMSIGGVTSTQLTAILSPDNFFARLFECYWCLTTWITTGVMLLYLLLIGFPLIGIVFVLPAAIAVSGSINKFVNL